MQKKTDFMHRSSGRPPSDLARADRDALRNYVKSVRDYYRAPLRAIATSRNAQPETSFARLQRAVSTREGGITKQMASEILEIIDAFVTSHRGPVVLPIDPNDLAIAWQRILLKDALRDKRYSDQETEEIANDLRERLLDWGITLTGEHAELALASILHARLNRDW